MLISGVFFARCFIGITEILPWELKFKWGFQRSLYVSCKKKVVAWHYAQLKKLDGMNFTERLARLAALEKEPREKSRFESVVLDGAIVTRIKG